MNEDLKNVISKLYNNRPMPGQVLFADHLLKGLEANGYNIVQNVGDLGTFGVSGGINVAGQYTTEDVLTLNTAAKAEEVKPSRIRNVQALFTLFGIRRYPHKQARRMIEEILPGVLKRYISKSRDYGENAQNLGYKGQFADINRKFGKLKRAWWDDIPLTSESAEEVAEDMIAHLLLALLFVRDEKLLKEDKKVVAENPFDDKYEDEDDG